MRAVATFTVVGLLIGGAAGHRVVVVIVAERASMTSQLTDRGKESLLQAFADAWNRHDVDALMSTMTTDCVFEASGGNAVDGERHEGQRAVRAAYTAVFEQYPDLKANQNVLGLQEELTSTENKIAFARQAYNDSVMEYNTKRESFPETVFAGALGFGPAELLQSTESPEERKAPKVSLS